jgi:hypothetical protein
MALLAAKAVLRVLLVALVALLAAVAVALMLVLGHCVVELNVEEVGLVGAGWGVAVLSLCNTVGLVYVQGR